MRQAAKEVRKITTHKRHRASSQVTVTWMYCVADCPAKGYGDMYHGNVVHVEKCNCGARRRVEASVAGRRAGSWEVPGA
jgi:ferredoxin-like protein FixX